MNMTQHLPSTFVAASLVEITGVMVLFLVLLHFKSWVILEVSALDAWWGAIHVHEMMMMPLLVS